MVPTQQVRLGLDSRAWIAQWAVHDPIAAGVGAKVQRTASRSTAGSWTEMLQSNDIDAIYIAAPNSLHVRRAGEALAAGHHVLCEKPLLATPDEANVLQRLAAETGLVFVEAYHYRAHPLVNRLIGLLREGALGTIHSMHLSYGWRLDRQDFRLSRALGGGAWSDVGCYLVDLACNILPGERISAVSATVLPTADGQVDLRSTVTFRLGGVVVQAVASFLQPTASSLVTVRGSIGTVVIEEIFAPVAPDGTLRLAASTNCLEIQRALKHGLVSEPTLWTHTSYWFQLVEFCRRVVAGTGYSDPFRLPTCEAARACAVAVGSSTEGVQV